MTVRDWTAQLEQKWHYKSAGWRKLAYWGTRYAPRFWVKYSPGWFGIAFAIALKHQREQVRLNLRRLLGKRSLIAEQRDIAKTFIAYAHCLAESLGAERECAKSARCEVLNEDALTRLLEEPGGFIIVTAHTGGWDIAAQVLMARSGRPVLLVMDREPDAAARAFQDQLRRKQGVQVAHVGADALEGLALLRHLRQGGVVAAQLDRVPRSGRCLEVTLAGQPFSLPQGPFLLASLAQVPVLPLFVARRGYYDYEVRVGNSIRLSRRPEPSEVDSAARDVARLLEAFLLQHPEQWFNFAVPLASDSSVSAPSVSAPSADTASNTPSPPDQRSS
jgi:KDO2-lipid IV(A) lauroyltransferase